MDEIKDIVNKVIADISDKKPQTQMIIQEQWKGLVGEKGIKNTAIVDYKEDILIVHVTSPVWLYQMNMKKKHLKKELQKKVRDIKGIVFKIGKLKQF